MISEHRFTLLLASLLLLLLLTPGAYEFRAVAGGIGGPGLIALLFVLVTVAAIPAVSTSRKTAVVAILLAGPSVLLRVLDLFLQHELTGSGHLLSGALFLAFAIVLIIRHLFAAGRISLNTINAALCVYMLLGVLWANLFVLVDRLDSTAFSTPTSMYDDAVRATPAGRYVELLYYSFVTLTTLGYGDITPASGFARMLAVAEAIVGQIILVVLVARLVGVHVAQSVSGSSPRRHGD